MIERCAECGQRIWTHEVAEVAAFLDAMAKRLEVAPKGMSFKDAAECRMMAAKLRGARNERHR